MRFGLIVLVVFALLAGACGGADDDAVVTVDGAALSRGDLDSELDAIRDDLRWQVVEDQQPLERESISFHLGVISTVDEIDSAPFRTEAVAGVVDRLIDDQLVGAELQRLSASTSDSDRQAASEQSLRDPDSPYRPREIERFARQIALGRVLAESGDDIDEAVVERAYELALPGEGAVCLRHILLATEDDAAFVAEQLGAGVDFAATAAAVSLDPSTAESGGELGCVGRGTAPDDLVALENAAWDAEVGQIVGPVETERGFHVLEVTGYDPSLTEARDLIVSSPELLAVAWVRVARERAEVELDLPGARWDPAGIMPAGAAE